MVSGEEVERKFLVERLPLGLEEVPRQRIEQGYLVVGDVEVRLRRADDQTLLTIKGGHGLVRTEEEMVIELERFERLWPLTRGRRLRKIRHRVDAVIDLDVYEGGLAPLAVAEAEFGSIAEAEAWTPPAWLGAEVTGDAQWANQALAR